MSSLNKCGMVRILLIASAATAILGSYAVFGGSGGQNIVKLNPSIVRVESSGAWVEDSSAWTLFDLDTNTAYAPMAPARVMVTLPGARNIGLIKIYGSASYNLAVYDGSSGSWVAVPGLDNITPKSQTTAWNTLTATSALNTDKLMLEFTAAGGNAGGIKEIEIWGTDPGDPTLTLKNVKTASDFQKILSSSPMPYHMMQLGAMPQTIDVPADGNSYTVSFTLNSDPRLIKRAFLYYASYNADYPISPERRINGLSWMGGFVPTTSDNPAWKAHAEEISPSWLVNGINTIEFINQVTDRDHSSYSIRDLKLVAELDSGWNVLSSVTGTSENAVHSAQTVIDGDPATYFELKSTHNLDLKTERTVQPDTVRINLWCVSGVPSGTITLQYVESGQWKNFASGGSVDLSSLKDGWNDIKIPSVVATDTLRLNIQVTPDKKRRGATVGGINEIELIASPVGSRVGRGLVVNYPLNGEYFGRTAYIQGFLDSVPNSSETVQVDISGKTVSNIDGSFSVPVTKDETSYADQDDNDPWQSVITGTYPDSTVFTQTITLNKNLLNNGPSSTTNSSHAAMSKREKFSEEVSPGQAKKIQYGGVTLDIPADAVDQKTEITIIPLTEADLNRLNPGMINVTSPAAGYRFLPHMKFKKPIKISFGYSKALFAAGQTDNDINMYYYDESLLRWQQLTREKVDASASLVTSSSDHFTDIINSTLVVPEHPEALTFNPTSIKDIKAADPGTNIDLIEPPRANNKGTANLSYPIQIPKGRGAYTPDLRVTYTSNNANGWMGLGWDIPIPSIQVDTRWGVPQYNDTYETESYLLAGQELAPVFRWNTPKINRTTDLQFYKRVEGDFLRVIRKGSDPTNYRWEVTDKSGVKYYYGSSDQSRLSDYQNPSDIFQWFLDKVVDTNGNVTTFSYYKDSQEIYLNSLFDPSSPPKTSLSEENWVYLYPDTITYTQNNSTGAPAQYSVQFIRKAGNRQDLIISGIAGFKTAIRYILDSIVVKFKDKTIRSYKFDYIIGDFFKTLLSTITAKGANDQVFYSHSFDYYRMDHLDDGSIKGFGEQEAWYTPESDAITKIEDYATSKQTYQGIGPLPLKAPSTGSLTSHSESNVTTTRKFIDLNGDGLPDMVNPDGVYFNQFDQEAPSGTTTGFGPITNVGLGIIESEKKTTDSEGNATYTMAASMSNNKATTISSSNATLSDINGDGLVDSISNGAASLNLIPSQKKFAQGTWSNATDLSSLASSTTPYSPLADPVRKWVAPFSGDISIAGTIQKTKQENDGDGVILYVYRENTEIGKLTITGDDYTVHLLGEVENNTGSNSIDLTNVQQGERIYFRLNSIDNGENDQIIFDPVITYTNSGNQTQQSLQNLKDSIGRPLYTYQGSSDYSLIDSQKVVWASPFAGTMILNGTIKKHPTTDDVTVRILRASPNSAVDDTTIFKEYTLPADSEQTITLNETVDDVKEGEQFLFDISSKMNVDPNSVTFSVETAFSSITGCGITTDLSQFGCSTMSVDPNATDGNGNLIYRFKPQINLVVA